MKTLRDGDMGTVNGDPVSADGYDWYQLDMNGDDTGDGWAAGQFLSGGVLVGSPALVADGPLSIRQSPNKNASVVNTLVTGDAVEVIEGPISAGGIVWFGITSAKGEGYVAGRYLGPALGTSLS